MSNQNYTVLHLHSDLSSGVTNIDSVTKYNEYIDYAASLGMKAMAFSEHGSVFQFLKKKEAIEKHSMKYIHAEEFYVTENLYDKSGKKVRDNYHCLLIATNERSFHELNTLSSIAFDDDHKYYVPRITLDELLNTSDDIIVCTACIGGILYSGTETAKDKFLKFLIDNRHRCYLEIQHHSDSKQGDYNKYLHELHKKYNIPLVATTDTHALNEEHLKGRSILQKAKNIHFDSEDGWDMMFKTYDELVDAFKRQNALPMDVVLEAIENTNKIADRVQEFEITREYKYPHLWKEPEKLFKKKVNDGAKNRGIFKKSNYKEYKERVNYELKAYKHNGAIDFMLLMEDIINWCNKHDIKVGYGRGSVNGSVIAYLLGITEMDSIKHKLNFERFMNTERVSLSDIDTDFPPSRREEVKDYIISKDGLYCCDIITFNTIALKGAIRDVGRALEMPLDEVDSICKRVDDNEDQLREQYPELFEYVDIVNGTIVSVGSHPCGMVVSPHDVNSAFGTFRTSTSKYPISQINMKEIDSLNYVKLDLLNLDTIELINKTCELAGIERLSPDNVDINDVNVWNSMRNDTTQIFQWEGTTGDKYIKKLLSDENIEKFKKVSETIDRMTLLSIGNSAIRPAGASYRDDLANGVVRTSGSKEIDEFLKPTFGYLCFQEQIIEFLHQYCGFTMGEADIVRRHFAKKLGTDKDIPIIKDGGYMTEKKDHYIKGFITTMNEKYNMNKEDAEKAIVNFLQVIIDASEYLFSLNHSLPYSYEGYVSAWLRYYYPAEFIGTALNINKDKEEKTIAITNYAKKNGIRISPIKFRHSGAEYSCNRDERTVYKGIESLKYCNAKIANELYELRDKSYDTFTDLLVDIKNTTVDSRQLEILIKLNFFEEFGEPNALLEQVKVFDKIYGKKTAKKKDGFVFIWDYNLTIEKFREVMFDDIMSNDGVYKETEKQIKGFNSTKFIKAVCNEMSYPETTLMDKVKYQMECLGYIDIVDPEADKRLYCVTKVDVRKSIVNADIYELHSGKTQTVKLWRKDFDMNPFAEGNILYLYRVEKKNKREPSSKINPKTGKPIWVAVPDKWEFWLQSYRIEGGEPEYYD